MAAGLQVKPDGALDLVSLGALVHRLDSGIIPFRKATECRIHVSGGEFNVAANLADCFRLRTAVASAMVDYPVGDLIAERVRAMGVAPIYRTFAHDGVHGPTMAMVYSDQGHGVRAPVVFYNRSNEAAAQLKPGDFDWDEIFGQQGVRWFHTGGIFAALSASTAALTVEAVKAANKYGTIVGYDLNYRPSLWKSIGGLQKAQEVNREIARYVDVMIGNEEDFTASLGFAVKGAETLAHLETDAFKAIIKTAVAEFPNFKVAATTLRHVITATKNDWGAILYHDGKFYDSRAYPGLEILDRVGGGDSFASGLQFGFLAKNDPQLAVDYGAAHGAFASTTPGDTSMATQKEVEKLMQGGSARVVR